MRKRNILKQVWLSREESETLKKKMKKVGLNESTLIRNLILDFKPKEKPDEKFYEVMKQLYSLSNNMNQIARKANTLGFIDVPFYKKEIDKLNKFILDIREEYLVSNTNN